MMTDKDVNWREHLGLEEGPIMHLVTVIHPELDAASKAIGLKMFVVDLSDAPTKNDVLQRVASELEFPAYFGQNWDALVDLLSDLSWLPTPGGYVVVLKGTEKFQDASPEEFATFLEVVGQAAEHMRRGETAFHVVLIGAVRKFEIETSVGVMNVCDHREH